MNIESTNNELAAEVARSIESALASSRVNEPEQIAVSMHDGCALLEGTVQSWAQHEKATRAALTVPNVSTVDNRLALLVKGKPCER